MLSSRQKKIKVYELHKNFLLNFFFLEDREDDNDEDKFLLNYMIFFIYIKFMWNAKTLSKMKGFDFKDKIKKIKNKRD